MARTRLDFYSPLVVLAGLESLKREGWKLCYPEDHYQHACRFSESMLSAE